ncbi:hypothetical protein OXX80_014306, partial [Metschnikowia pulcherrima]
ERQGLLVCGKCHCAVTGHVERLRGQRACQHRGIWVPYRIHTRNVGRSPGRLGGPSNRDCIDAICRDRRSGASGHVCCFEGARNLGGGKEWRLSYRDRGRVEGC